MDEEDLDQIIGILNSKEESPAQEVYSEINSPSDTYPSSQKPSLPIANQMHKAD